MNSSKTRAPELKMITRDFSRNDKAPFWRQTDSEDFKIKYQIRTGKPNLYAPWSDCDKTTLAELIENFNSSQIRKTEAKEINYPYSV